MASQSTPISDLPRSDNQSNEDIQESMMVNSILEDIENDEDLNDVNQESLQYSIDTSQIPPKIGNELPSVETIQETTNTIFNEVPSGESLMNEPPATEIDDFLNQKLNQVNSEEPREEVKEKSVLQKIEERAPLFLIIIVGFVLLTLQPLNSFIIRMIPRLASNGNINLMGNMIKGLILGLIYLGCSFFV